MSLLSILQELTDFDTALLANTIGAIDPTPAHEFYMSGAIASVTPTLGPTVGVAVTCEIDTSSPTNKREVEIYVEILKAIERIQEPVVLVAKAVGSRPEHECIIGDGMAKTLYSVGCIGIVTDGGVRDVEGLMTVPFAAYGRGRVIHHTALRFVSYNRPIAIGGITVSPGEVIHANIGGVIKIPAGCLAALPERATAMRAFEHDAHRIWRQTDLSIDEKHRQVGLLVAKTGF